MPATRPIEERLRARTTFTATCWIWQGSGPNGYGAIGTGGRSGHMVLVHRWAYERFVGPIPEGRHIDHVKARGCTSRKCWNPAHLEAVTQAENNRRVDQGDRRWERCAQGHELTDENRGSGGKCKACHLRRQREYLARRAATVAH